MVAALVVAWLARGTPLVAAALRRRLLLAFGLALLLRLSFSVAQRAAIGLWRDRAGARIGGHRDRAVLVAGENVARGAVRPRESRLPLAGAGAGSAPAALRRVPGRGIFPRASADALPMDGCAHHRRVLHRLAMLACRDARAAHRRQLGGRALWATRLRRSRASRASCARSQSRMRSSPPRRRFAHSPAIPRSACAV